MEEIITPRAKSSLEEIVDYLTEEYSPEAAEKVRKRIMEAISTVNISILAHQSSQYSMLKHGRERF